MLTELITGYRKSTALYAFVESEAPIYIGQVCAATLREIVRHTKTIEGRFKRLLDVMVECNILSFHKGKYSLTEKSANLARQDSIETLWIKCELGEHYWTIWPGYFSSLHKGSNKPAFENKHGSSFFEFLSRTPKLKDNFDNLMAAITDEISDELVTIFDIHPGKTVVDIGGGKGILARKIKSAFSTKHCIVMDRYEEGKTEKDEVTYLNGNFFTNIVAGADVYILKNILHNWNDEQAGKILKNCANAMQEHSVLYIIEIIKEQGSEKGKTLDLLMDVLFLGKERYYSEYQSLAYENNLVIEHIIPTSFSQSVIFIRKVND